MPDTPAPADRIPDTSARTCGRAAADSADGPEPVPRLLCDIAAQAATEPASPGASWKLDESGRQLDANLIRLPGGGRVETHAEPDLDVLLLVVAGHGNMDTSDDTVRLAGGALCWLPRGSTRRITADTDGLTYLTVHRRRPGLQIRSGPS